MIRLPVPPRYDLARTVGGLALIHGDPTIATTANEAWFATRTPDGPGTLRLVRDGAALTATAFGAGADWLLERAERVAGLSDDVSGFAELAARHPLVARLAREHSGLRMAASGRVFHHLIPAVLGQKVTGKEAYHAYVRVLRRFGQRAPGPHPRLWVPPDADVIAHTPYWALHPFGVEQKRADALRRAAARAGALERAIDATDATAKLMSLPGIGVWTAAEVVRVAYGDPDAVSVGDYHLKNIVAYALSGAPRGDDARMLELLEPFAGHRGRVCQLLAAAGIGAPRFGPRMPMRSFAKM